MRSVCLAVVVASFSIACGSYSSGTGNEFVTEQALNTTIGSNDQGTAIQVVRIGVNVSDRGCSIDGQRFSNCTIAPSPSSQFVGPSNLCELQAGNASSTIGQSERYFTDCELGIGAENMTEDALQPVQQLPEHCPGEK